MTPPKHNMNKVQGITPPNNARVSFQDIYDIIIIDIVILRKLDIKISNVLDSPC